MFIVSYIHPDDSSENYVLGICDTKATAEKMIACLYVDKVSQGIADGELEISECINFLTDMNNAMANANYGQVNNIYFNLMNGRDGVEYFNIESWSKLTTLADIGTPVQFNLDQDEDEDEADEEDENEAPVSFTPDVGNYQAANPGATCRGKCGQHSPYAYADKPDGTYHCFQCRTFSDIFS